MPDGDINKECLVKSNKYDRGVELDPQVEQVKHQDRDSNLADLRPQPAQLREEEANLGRLHITGKIGERIYEQLRMEWQDKLRWAELCLS